MQWLSIFYPWDISQFDILVTFGFKKGTISLLKNGKRVSSIRIWQLTDYWGPLHRIVRNIATKSWRTPTKKFFGDGTWNYGDNVEHYMLSMGEFLEVVYNLLPELRPKSRKIFSRKLHDLMAI